MIVADVGNDVPLTAGRQYGSASKPGDQLSLSRQRRRIQNTEVIATEQAKPQHQGMINISFLRPEYEAAYMIPICTTPKSCAAGSTRRIRKANGYARREQDRS